jgi:pyruvate dehydrogenase E1 component beta subunit/2-oxoisovalerate dehydrogenase E1 component
LTRYVYAPERPAPPPPKSAASKAKVETTYREAVRAAICEALDRDERVFLMGEDVGRYGGCYAVTKGLLDAYGPDRIRDTPLSEAAFTGAGIGAGMAGMRPIVEVMTVNFSLLALDQILNNAATIRHMSGNQFGCPVVIRMAPGGNLQRSTRTASRAGTRISPAFASWRRRRLKTRAACCGPRCRSRTRCSSSRMSCFTT